MAGSDLNTDRRLKKHIVAIWHPYQENHQFENLKF